MSTVQQGAVVRHVGRILTLNFQTKKWRSLFVWKMAGASKEEELARHVYSSLQAASCPLVEGLYLQEADSMLQLLCTPSQHRTDILAWICSSINPNFDNTPSVRTKDPDVLNKEMALFGQELMLCKGSDLDLIKGDASPHRQLEFLEQLFTLVPGCRKPSVPRVDPRILLNELYAADNLPFLTEMLKPTLNPWPAHIEALGKGTETTSKPSREDAAHVGALLQQTQTALEQLQSECDFLSPEAQSPVVFSPNSLRVAAGDLQQLMSTFSHVYETNLRTYCGRDPPKFSAETDVFQRVHQLLLAFITELEIIREVSEASVSMSEEVNRLQTQPNYWSRGEKRTLENQLEELTRRTKDFMSLLQS